jgi:hypothetical protein
LPCVCAIAAFPGSSQAGPMGFKDSWMVMGDFGPNWRESFANYAFTPQDAVGVAATYMRSDDTLRSLDLTDVTYTRLLHRWNLPDAQANLWFAGGLGEARTNEQDGPSGSKLMASPGVQFDYETTRVYFAATTRLYRAQGINHDFASARAGFSFYETDFDQTQPWFVVEARRMHDLSDKTEITPMLRLVNKDYFIEAGVNNSRQLRFNFMYIL